MTGRLDRSILTGIGALIVLGIALSCCTGLAVSQVEPPGDCHLVIVQKWPESEWALLCSMESWEDWTRVTVTEDLGSARVCLRRMFTTETVCLEAVRVDVVELEPTPELVRRR